MKTYLSFDRTKNSVRNTIITVKTRQFVLLLNNSFITSIKEHKLYCGFIFGSEIHKIDTVRNSKFNTDVDLSSIPLCFFSSKDLFRNIRQTIPIKDYGET